MTTIASLADIVRTHGTRRADRTALVLGDRRQPWGELYERSCRAAQALAAAGVGSQDRIAFLDKNGIEHFEVFYGAALLNAVCVDVNWRLAPPEVAFIVNDAAAKVLVVGPEFVPVLDAIADQLSVGTVVVIDGLAASASHDGLPTKASDGASNGASNGAPAAAGTGNEPSRRLDYGAWIGAHEAVDPHTPSLSGHVAFQLYSSGTTGRPKGVMLSNDNLFGLLPLALAQWGMDEHTVNLAAMPLFHIGGGGWAVAGMWLGCTTVLVRDIDPVALVALFGHERITHAFVVPALLQFMLMVPGVADADYSSLKMIAYGASPISDDVLARSIAAFTCDFWQVYGLTETTGAIVGLPPEDHDPAGPNRHRLRSCGKANPGVELCIADPASGESCATGDVGEILVRSPQVMVGYWNQPAETAKAIDADGWFHTGDAGYLDADGYLYIHDRVKDMIVSGGENVYPAEVENVLMAHPGVADCAVIGVPDDRWGETPKAVVVRAAGAPLTDAELLAHCRTQLAGFKCPTSVDWVDALPRNPTGKILKKDLRAPYWEGRTRNVN